MAGFARPWWIVGGWAIEAFTGVPREHEDVDLSILACDIPAFRAHVGDALDTSGATTAARCVRSTTGSPRCSTSSSQIWVRRSAHGPVGHRPADHARTGTGLWTNKRDPDHVAPLEEATWVAADGIRYLRPEIALLYKAALHRPKDDARPGASPGRCWTRTPADWLREAVQRLYPDHPWLARL